MKTYAIYKGDKFIDVGTAQELANRLHITTHTVYTYAARHYIKKCKNRNKRMAIVIEE